METICAPWFHRYNDGMSTSNETHSVLVGYILWIFGFTGSHRFYYGKPITGTRDHLPPSLRSADDTRTET